MNWVVWRRFEGSGVVREGSCSCWSLVVIGFGFNRGEEPRYPIAKNTLKSGEMGKGFRGMKNRACFCCNRS